MKWKIYGFAVARGRGRWSGRLHHRIYIEFICLHVFGDRKPFVCLISGECVTSQFMRDHRVCVAFDSMHFSLTLQRPANSQWVKLSSCECECCLAANLLMHATTSSVCGVRSASNELNEHNKQHNIDRNAWRAGESRRLPKRVRENVCIGRREFQWSVFSNWLRVGQQCFGGCRALHTMNWTR